MHFKTFYKRAKKKKQLYWQEVPEQRCRNSVPVSRKVAKHRTGAIRFKFKHCLSYTHYALTGSNIREPIAPCDLTKFIYRCDNQSTNQPTNQPSVINHQSINHQSINQSVLLLQEQAHNTDRVTEEREIVRNY